jgi:dipeptidyl aminopeptidase/acylaminoacyl peptidase
LQKPYGTWTSPISAAVVAAQGLRLSAATVDGGDIYWVEGRPNEGGRNVLVRCGRHGALVDITPSGFNVRSRVHEYGGGAYTCANGDVYFSNFDDQRLYHVRTDASGTLSMPRPITPAGDWFYSDGVVDARRRRLISVREDHTGKGEPVNALVSIDLDGGESSGDIIASGHDFYSTPRLSPDGSRLAWLAWRHPQMPWDGTELWIADVTDGGAVANARPVAGSESESIYQPGWSPDGTLYFASDRDGWWRLYRLDASHVAAVIRNPPDAAECGRPQWVFGTATWAFAGRSRIVAAFSQRGHWRLATIDVETGAWRSIDTDLEPHDWLTATPTHAVMVAASATMADAVVRLDLDSGEAEIVRRSSTLRLDAEDVAKPEAIEFPSGNGQTSHAFYYAPRNSACSAAEGDRPPLVAISHGGPTTATMATLDLRIQFWTTRGFAVVDVNYGGSSGYGRAYRERLAGHWGIVDVADLVNAARHLVSEGKADPHRLLIRGGSAGGYTTLAALTFHPGVFNAGASYYGVSDIEQLARDTHKFESRYLDRLIGPYPEMRDVYRARSPIHFVDRLSCPLILFQGLEDKVVPPSQSQLMAEAVRAKGLPVAYLTFDGEQHGFRKAETIIRSLEAELYFYGAVFGFTPADDLEPVHIDNRSPTST